MKKLKNLTFHVHISITNGNFEKITFIVALTLSNRNAIFLPSTPPQKRCRLQMVTYFDIICFSQISQEQSNFLKQITLHMETLPFFEDKKVAVGLGILKFQPHHQFFLVMELRPVFFKVWVPDWAQTFRWITRFFPDLKCWLQ